MYITVALSLIVFNVVSGQFMPGPQPLFPGGNEIFPGPNTPIQPTPRQIPTNNILNADPFVYGTCSFNESGSNIRGRVDFRQLRRGGPTQVRVQVIGLAPSLMSDTEHGMHVHEYGDVGRGCYAAGRHYDSDSFSFHGSPNNLGQGNAHEGDMGNLRQSNSGVIDTDLNLPLMRLVGDLGVVGRAVVLKEGRDDLGRGGNSMSLQTGNAGAPLACCVIGLSDASKWNNPLIPRQNSGFQGTPSTTNTFVPNTGFNPNFNRQPVQGIIGNGPQGFPVNPDQGLPGNVDQVFPGDPTQGFPGNLQQGFPGNPGQPAFGPFPG